MAFTVIEFRNTDTGQAGVMSDVTPRESVLQAYHEYEQGQLDYVDLEKTYGGLVTEDTPDKARLGNWVAEKAAY